jgi:integrase
MQAALRTIADLHADELRRSLALRSVTIGEAVDLYFANQPNLTPSTRARYILALTPFRARFARVNVGDVRPLDLDRFLFARSQQVASTTYYEEVRLLKLIFVRLLEDFQLTVNPARHLVARVGHPESHRSIDAKEEMRLLSSCPSEYLPRLLLALDAGLRIRDLLALRKSNIDLASRTLTFFVQKSRLNLTLPLTSRLEATLGAFVARRQTESLFTFAPGSRGPHDWFYRFSRRAGVLCSPHDLRRTFANRLFAVNHNRLVKEYCLGHDLRNVDALGYLDPPTLTELRETFRAMEAAREAEFQKLRGIDTLTTAEIWRELEQT